MKHNTTDTETQHFKIILSFIFFSHAPPHAIDASNCHRQSCKISHFQSQGCQIYSTKYTLCNGPQKIWQSNMFLYHQQFEHFEWFYWLQWKLLGVPTGDRSWVFCFLCDCIDPPPQTTKDINNWDVNILRSSDPICQKRLAILCWLNSQHLSLFYLQHTKPCKFWFI
jgi:hypothetical protein